MGSRGGRRDEVTRTPTEIPLARPQDFERRDLSGAGGPRRGPTQNSFTRLKIL